METANKPATIDSYISGFPKDVQQILQKIRKSAKIIAPEAEETISYGVPTFKLNGTYIVYFAGYKNHISLYPIPDGPESFLKKIEPYKAGKGTLQFQLKNPIPWELISEIIENSLHTNLERSAAKKSKKSTSASQRAS